MKTLYNTLSEISSRLLILLSECDEPKDIETLTLYDLFSTYGKRYGFLDNNLHGDAVINVNEFSTRSTLVSESIGFLVKNGQVNYIAGANGFVYSSTPGGDDISKSFSSQYALEYRTAVKGILYQTKGMGIPELKSIVFRKH